MSDDKRQWHLGADGNVEFFDEITPSPVPTPNTKLDELFEEIGLNYDHRECKKDCSGRVAYDEAKQALNDYFYQEFIDLIGKNDKDIADKLYPDKPERSLRFVRETHRSFFNGKNQLRENLRQAAKIRFERKI